MGMFNEVFKKCPRCEWGTGYMQISQIELGFGGYNLDNYDTISHLDEEQIVALFDKVSRDSFQCGGDYLTEKRDSNCGCTFTLDEALGELNTETVEAKRNLFNTLFTEEGRQGR